MRRNQLGFTITELMVSTFLAGFMVILIFGLTVYLYGDQLRASAKANMILESQLFLREMLEDIRVAGEVRATNQIIDANEPTGGWVTSDPSNILIITYPATDEDGDFVLDSNNGFPYQNEIIYHGDGSNMYKRLLANPDGITDGSDDVTTCPEALATASCPADAKLSENLDNLEFTFFDIDDSPTSVIADAYAVQLTVNLKDTIFGRDVIVSNSIKATMRNNQN